VAAQLGSDGGGCAMSDNEGNVRRTLHLRFTYPGADSEQLSALMRASAPFYQLFGNAQFKLLRNADDPGKFIQVIEYETPQSFEFNRQSLAGDMRMQTFLQAWRAMLPGGLEIDVYQEV
jgi:quinol monooxygenase YgiN